MIITTNSPRQNTRERDHHLPHLLIPTPVFLPAAEGEGDHKTRGWGAGADRRDSGTDQGGGDGKGEVRPGTWWQRG